MRDRGVGRSRWGPLGAAGLAQLVLPAMRRAANPSSARGTNRKAAAAAAAEEMPAEYDTIAPGIIPPTTFDLLGKYLMSGSIGHIDTVEQCLEMIKMCKTYGLCRDVLCTRIMAMLKEMVEITEVMSVISCVGDIVETVNEQGASNFCFEPRDSFFLDLALDKADEFFYFFSFLKSKGLAP